MFLLIVVVFLFLVSRQFSKCVLGGGQGVRFVQGVLISKMFWVAKVLLGGSWWLSCHCCEVAKVFWFIRYLGLLKHC